VSADAAVSGRMEIEFAEQTDIGCVRPANDDAVGAWPYRGGLLFAIADGIGGAAAGDIASRIALEALAAAMRDARPDGPVHKRLRAAVQAANLAVHDASLADASRRLMRTTLTATAIVDGTLVAAHVGDCRLYRFRAGRLECLTRDHNRAWWLVRFGSLGSAAARQNPRRHVLTRCLGEDPIVRIDIVRAALSPADVLLQCSDGLYGLVAEHAIAKILAALPPSLACRALLDAARRAGGDDNASVQIASLPGGR
jgi:PPM family protein phosphatase